MYSLSRPQRLRFFRSGRFENGARVQIGVMCTSAALSKRSANCGSWFCENGIAVSDAPVLKRLAVPLKRAAVPNALRMCFENRHVVMWQVKGEFPCALVLRALRIA